jgi:hypothetical protein
MLSGITTPDGEEIKHHDFAAKRTKVETPSIQRANRVVGDCFAGQFPDFGFGLYALHRDDRDDPYKKDCERPE